VGVDACNQYLPATQRSFSKIEDNGTAPLLIFFLEALRMIAFCLLKVPWVAGWLRLKLQADNGKQKSLLP